MLVSTSGLWLLETDTDLKTRPDYWIRSRENGRSEF